ncbi:MAG TPA: glycosyltransferase family 39 protein, partial [Vicinamibacteria bacterium]|nr:glycosyltransferase family 39 protein [Vicinamibacteria bacterium]
MIPTDPLVAAAAGAVLFLAPGLTALALLSPASRAPLARDERLFLVLASSVMASAWVALLLAEAGVFSLGRAAVVVAGACVVIAGVGRSRRGQAPHPASDGRTTDTGPHDVAPVPHRLWPALALAVLSFVMMARPGEYLLGGRDPGVYVATMGLIARTGGIAWTDPTVTSIPAEDVELFYRHPEKGDWSWGRFMGVPLENPRTGRVVPEFFHLFPAFGAYLFQAMGVKGGLATPPVFGVLGTVAAYLFLRRAIGETPALLAAALLAVNVVQVWFARYPVSEPMSQFLLLTALWAFLLWDASRRPFYGVLAGAALGLNLLVRIDGVLLLVPVLLWLAARRLTHHLTWREASPLVLPLAAGALHALLHAAFWSRKYLLGIVNRPYWHQPAWVWLVGTAGVLGLILTVHRLRPT